MKQLLPKSSSDFSTKDYWERFFTEREASFEWYGEYHQLSSILFKYVKSSDRILVVGCGNSTMSYDLHKSGYQNSVSIDISEVAVTRMTKKYPDVKFVRMDATKLEFDDAEFSIVIDKGTIDALLPDVSKQNAATVEKILAEVSRCLRNGGRFLCVTLLQEQVACLLLGFFSRAPDDVTWVVRVHRCVEAEDTSHAGLSLPVYVVVVTKMKRLGPVGPCIVEWMASVDAKPTRFATVDALIAEIKDQQNYSFLRSHLRRNTLDQEYRTELFSPESDKPKYELFIVDTPGVDRQSDPKFECFIVPEGREAEWLFGTPEGRKVLARQRQVFRIVFVHLSRHFTYSSIDEIKSELSLPLNELVPRNFKPGTKIPFLSVGEATGNRTIVERGRSALSGDFTVEDVTVGHDVFRRLVFLDRPNVIQTEMRLHQGKLDYTYLSNGYYNLMVAAVGFFDTRRAGSSLVLGLGGGTLASFVAKYAKWKVLAVELDQAIIDVAKQRFGLVKGVDAICADALEFVKTSQDEFDIIWLDIDSKDATKALTCPPEEFLKEEFLTAVAARLGANGVLVINLFCRDKAKCKEVYGVLKATFRHVKSIDVPEYVNELIFVSNGNPLECNVKEVRSLLRRSNKENDVENMEKMLADVQI